MYKHGLLKEFSTVFAFFIRTFDLLIVILGSVGAHYYRFGNINLDTRYETAIILGVLLAALILPAFQLYDSWRGKGLIKQLWVVTLAWLSVSFLLAIIAFSVKTGADYSRIWAGHWLMYTWLLLILSRIAIRAGFSFMRKKGWNRRQIVIIGAGSLGKRTYHQLSEADWVGYDLVAFWDDRINRSKEIIGGTGIPVISVEEGVDLLISGETVVDEVWLALPLRAEKRMHEILNLLRHSTVRVRLIPDIFAFRLLNHSISEIAGIPVLDISASPMTGMNRIIKEVEDRMIGIVLFILIIPLALFISIGVKLSSPGPILFKQMRYGWDGKPIKIYKFRTMVCHEESNGAVTQACKGDKRITPFGAFLRRTSLDELPQFYNVLQGRMSIVGPRPHAVAHNELYKDQIDDYMQRHRVKPGITGWAQVNGFRGETNTLDKMKCRVDYDLFYIENWSLWFDLKIISLTIIKGFIDKNAY
jgi:putative colanic acid biosynthesis UDP-glucose lipid carrier transferase